MTLTQPEQTPADAPAGSEAPASPAAPSVPPPAKPAHHRRKHRARIEHRMPGRIRMKVPAAVHDPSLLEIYCKAFSSIPGVLSVKPKPHSGSIVIHYDETREHEFAPHFERHVEEHLTLPAGPRPGDEIEDMAMKIEREAEFLAQRSELAKATVEFFKKFDAELKVTTDNTVDLKILLAGGLAAYTFLEIGAAAATPMWVTLALFSLNHFAELHSHLAPPPPPQPAPARS